VACSSQPLELPPPGALTSAANPNIKYLLVMNEPNLTSQSNLTPAQAAAVWPGYEAISAHTGVKIVGPQITWGRMTGFSDPVVWMDTFIAAYQPANGGRSPQIDDLAVATCEARADVVRYAWFTGRWNNDVHLTSLLSRPGQLTDLGKLYLALPYTAQ
jgi:hypothetical protein